MLKTGRLNLRGTLNDRKYSNNKEATQLALVEAPRDFGP